LSFEFLAGVFFASGGWVYPPAWANMATSDIRNPWAFLYGTIIEQNGDCPVPCLMNGGLKTWYIYNMMGVVIGDILGFY
jgi:hypothetical protein